MSDPSVLGYYCDIPAEDLIVNHPCTRAKNNLQNKLALPPVTGKQNFTTGLTTSFRIHSKRGPWRHRKSLIKWLSRNHGTIPNVAAGFPMYIVHGYRISTAVWQRDLGDAGVVLELVCKLWLIQSGLLWYLYKCQQGSLGVFMSLFTTSNSRTFSYNLQQIM